MVSAVYDPYDDPTYTEHSFVTSRELQYRMQRDALKEAGKAIVAIPGIVPNRTKNSLSILAPEIPKYNIRIYQKMFEKIDLARSIIQRAVELVLSPDIDIRPPASVLKADVQINDDLKKNISFCRKWVRWIRFNSWLKQALTCAFWAGNSYTEIVTAKGEGKKIKGRPAGKESWKILELKLISPDEMRPIRDAYGQVKGYVQYPFNTPITWLSKTQADKYIDNGAVSFEPHEILHMKFDVDPGEAYGTSKLEAVKDILAIYVGMREDIAMAIKNYAAPTVLFRIGTELIPASPTVVNSFRSNLMSQMRVSSNIVTSTMVQPQVIETGKAVMNMEKYMQQMLGILFGSFGLPEILLGQGNETTEATAKMQLEAAAYQFKVVHQDIKDNVELDLFSKLSVGKWFDQLTPGDMDNIPELFFGPIETEEDKRFRYTEGFKDGIYTREECRKPYGMNPKPEGELVSTENLKFQMKLEEHKAKMAKKYAPPQAPAGGTGKPPAKDTKPTSTKKDRDDGKP